ncbi:MAG: restriction endonuclease subunit S [Firmicutes bacterium]|nr:restriction endonuclease subunit S [Bacillota bacterium]
MSFSDWENTKLSDICEFQKGYAFKSKDYQNKGRKIVKVSDLNNYSVNYNECICISDEKANDFSKYTLETDDIIITTVGSWPQNPNSVVGKVIKVQKEVSGALLNQNAVRVRVKVNVNQRFIFYVLKNKDFFDYIIGTAQGAANQASITQSDIFNYIFKLPNIKVQNTIANTLICLDNKIEINNQINKNLEEMAQAIYKSWFVDFEPFQDGEFDESELGRIPKGWNTKQLGELIKKNKAKINNFDDWKNELIIDLSNMPRFSMCINQFDKGEKFATNIYKLNKYDILFGSIRSYFGKAGFSPIDGVVTGTVHSYKPTNEEDYSFVLLLTTSKKFIDYTVAVSTGTKMPIVNWDNFCRYSCIYPNTESILLEFNELIMPLIKKMENNILENQKLISLRDSLLPKLLSGEIRVPLETINE